MKRHMKKYICTIAFSTLLAGCAEAPLQADDNAPTVYIGQQAFAERTPMELWVEMRQESEVKEVTDVKWVSKAKQLEMAAGSETKRLAKANAVKNSKRSNKQEKQPDEAGENNPKSSAPKDSPS